MGFPSSSTILYRLPDCVALVCVCVRLKEGDGRFDSAAILQTDYEPEFCVWVLPWQVVQVK